MSEIVEEGGDASKKVFRAPPGRPRKIPLTEEELSARMAALPLKAYVVVPQPEEVRPEVVTPEGYVVKQPRAFRGPPGRPKRGTKPPPSGKELVAKEFQRNRKLAAIFERQEGFAELQDHERLRQLAKLARKQTEHGVLIVLTDNIEEISLEPEKLEIHKQKMNYVKDKIWLYKELESMADRVEQQAEEGVVLTEVHQEVTDVIAKAQRKLGLGSGSDGND